MNIFKRKDTELDPYKFDPTRSSASLAIVFLITLALSYLYVLHKKPQTNAIELLAELNHGNNLGLSKHITADNQLNLYLLLKDGSPVGYAVNRVRWRGNFLIGVDIVHLPDSDLFTSVEWRVSNNIANWVTESVIRKDNNVFRELKSLNQGILSYENNQVRFDYKLSSISYNYVPEFLLDYIASIGIKRFPEGLSFTFDIDQNSLKVCTISQAATNEFPAEITALDPNGTALSIKYNDIETVQFFSEDNKLIYQIISGSNQKVDTQKLSDRQTIIELWPEAAQVIPEQTAPLTVETEI